MKTIGIQLGETVAKINEAGERLKKLVARTASKPATTLSGSTCEPEPGDLLLDDERFDGIDNKE
jgi:hypothetical protein